MGNFLKHVTATEQEFGKLAVQLVETANDTIKCLKNLKRNLAKYDSRHGLHFRSSSKFFMRSDIRVVKDTTTDLRYVAKRIDRNKSPTKSEINAARISMNATADAMNDLMQAGRVFDQNNDVSGDTTDIIDKILGSNGDNNKQDKEGLFVCRDNVSKAIRTSSDNCGPSFAKTNELVEIVVRSTLSENFNGFYALEQQVRATENSMSLSIATRAKNAVVEVASKLIGNSGLSPTPYDNQCGHM